MWKEPRNPPVCTNYEVHATHEIGRQIPPAWPKDWEVSFRLHGAGRIVVECIYLNGKMEKLEVTPKAREKDLILPESL